jgi:hypothetical protein
VGDGRSMAGRQIRRACWSRTHMVTHLELKHEALEQRRACQTMTMTRDQGW